MDEKNGFIASKHDWESLLGKFESVWSVWSASYDFNPTTIFCMC